MDRDYITDVPYHRSFAADLAPSRMRLVAALNGFPPPAQGDYHYCELGCAHGDTVSVLAAANPRARFAGIDLNPAHIEAAERSVREGELDNTQFFQGNFAESVDDSISNLDFVTAHGVLTWVGPETRKALMAFAGTRLKPGGLLYVGYNALPGWAALAPLRELLFTGSAGSKGDSLERARMGFALAKHLHDAGAIYFTANPSAGAMLKEMEEGGLPYIAHEYLNGEWTPMYFAQVLREMAEHDLHFVGQFPLYSNYRDLVIPPSMAKLFESVRDRAMFESLKDFAINEFFRRDVFVKGRAGRSEKATRDYLESTIFGLAGTLPVEEVKLPNGTMTFEGPLFEALFSALAQEPAAGAALARRRDLEAFGAESVRAALLRALIAERVIPMQEPRRAAEGKPGELLRVPSPYNRMVLRRGLEKDIPRVLASPVTGTGVPATPLEILVLRLLTEVSASKWRAWLDELFARGGTRLHVKDRVVEGAAGTEVVLAEVNRFREKQLARFVDWGILM